MPGLALLATSPALLSAVIGVAVPEGLPQPRRAEVLPLAWTLASMQDAAPPKEGPSAEGEPPATEPPVTEIVVEGQIGPPKSDPVEAINEGSYKVSQAVDRVLVKPIAIGYRDGLPEPIRDGLGNVVRNLGEPTNALNFLLQGKIGKAFETLGRMAINSTLGVGGLFDVAGKKADLPYRRNGFANTLGYYGVGPGPYLFVPITGPTTVRDQIGVALDQALLPFAVGKPFNRPEYAISYFTINSLDSRLRDNPQLEAIAASDDPYVARRETYLAQRRADIAALKGEPVAEKDRLLLEAMMMARPAEAPADADAPAPSAAQPADATPVEPPANPENVGITRPGR